MSEITNSPGTMWNNYSVGTLLWADINNAKVSDGSYATASVYNVDWGYTIKDKLVKIVKANSSIGDENKGNYTSLETSDTYRVYGSDSDLWGEVWTPNDINNSNFGVVVSYEIAEEYGGLVSNTYYLKASNFSFSIPDNSTIYGIKAEIEAKGLSYSADFKHYGTAYVDHIRITVYYIEASSTTISSKCSIKKTLEKVVSSKSSIQTPDISKTVTSKALITHLSQQTLSSKARIFTSGVTKSSQSKLDIKKTASLGERRRAVLTIDHTKVGEDLVDYPLYINLADLDDTFWSQVKNGGGDIRIFLSDGTTECPREIVSCDTSTKTGEVHTLISSVSSSVDTIVYLYYGDPNLNDYEVTDIYGAQAVWGSNAKLIANFEGNTNDSSGNNGAGTINGTVDEVAGKIGKAYDFDGLGNYIDYGKDVLDGLDDFTISAWIKNRNPIIGSDYRQQIIGNGRYGVSIWGFDLEGGDTLRLHYNNNQYISDFTGLNDNQDHLVKVVHSGSNLIFYVDGVKQVKSAFSGAVSGLTNSYIATRYPLNDFRRFIGTIDSIRVIGEIQSDNYILTEYNNQSESDTFYSITYETLVNNGLTSKSRIQIIDITKTVSSKARIQRIESKILTSKASIFKVALKTVSSKSAIQRTFEKSVSSKARIQISNITKTATSKARILTGGVIKSVSSKLDIKKTAHWGVRRRYKITIDHTKVGGNDINYPLFIDLGLLDNNFWNYVRNGGGDIRVFASDGITELPREVVTCDTSAKIGEVHTKVASISTSVDTVIYLYYGNFSATDYAPTDPYGRNAVWTDLATVWHMKDLTTSSIQGSKGAYDLTKIGANQPIEISAKIGKGQDYDGVNDSAYTAKEAVDTSIPHSFVAWVYWDVAQGTNNRGIIDKFKMETGNHQSGSNLMLSKDNKRLKHQIGDGVGYHIQTLEWDTNFPIGEYVFVAGVISATEIKLCQNGAFKTSAKTINQVNFTCNVTVGNTHHSNGFLDGKIDEARIYPFALTEAQLTTIYNNQSAPNTFYSSVYEYLGDTGLSSKSRVQTNGVTKTVSSKLNIRVTTTRTVSSKARVKVTQTKTISSKFDIKKTFDQTISSKTRILVGGVTKAISSKTDIKLLGVSRTVSSKCRIQTTETKTVSSKANIVPYIAPELTFKEHSLRYALYTPAGVYIKDLENIISDFSVTKNLNGGLNSIEITIKAPIDDYDEYDSVKNPTGSIRYGNRVKVLLNDTYNTDKVIFWGYLTDINPNFSSGQERVSLTFYSALSKLSNDYLRTYSDPIDFYYVETAKSTSTIIKDILDNYIDNISNSMISYSWGTSISDCGNVVTYTFDRLKHLDSLKKIQEYLPATWYWYIDALGVVYVKDSSSTTQHKLTLGKDIIELSVKKSSAEIVNYFFLWNGRSTADASYVYEDYADAGSQAEYDKMVLFQDDTEVLASTVADIRGTALITNKKDPQEQWTLTLTDDYNLASLEPGHRVSIRNIKSDTQSTVSDDLVIQKITYKIDRAVIQVGAVGHDLTKYTAEEENAVQQSILQAQRATELIQSGTTPITKANIWYNGNQFIEDDVVYSPVIAGVNGYFKESIRLGDNGVGAVIRSYGKAAFNNGVAGFWLEKTSGNTVKFELYKDANNFLKVDLGVGTFAFSGIITIVGGSTGIANLSDAGTLALLDSIGAGNCDTTIISGGKIITGLLTADRIQTGTLTVDPGLKADGIVVNSGGDVIFNCTSYSSFSEIIFNKTGVANKGWEIYFVATGGGGYQAGDLNILPMSSNDSDTVRIGMAAVPCDLVVHGDVYADNIGGSVDLTNVATDISPDSAFTRNVGTATKPFLTMQATTYYFNRNGYTQKYIQMSSDGSVIECNHTFYTAKMKLPVGTNLY